MKVYILERFDDTNEGLFSLIEDVYGNEYQASLRRDKLIQQNKNKKVYFQISEFEIKGKIDESRT